ncbi:MAG: helix-turn-helix transcriptional regulator [Bacilli bacterium]|nr:helix-turn-helix transcriptional regulator [Bacilli bacterium]
MNQKKIGKFIQEKRKEKKLTQMELASKLGVSNRSVSKWENGVCLPDYSLFSDLCSILDISINELLSGEKVENDFYQKKMEENIVNVIDYNNKKRNKKIKRVLIIIFIILLIISFYKLFVIHYYYNLEDKYDYQNYFPNNKNISIMNVEENELANKEFENIKLYIPEKYELITDKAKSRAVTDNCDSYFLNLNGDNYESAIIVCSEANLINLDKYDIRDSLFPYLNVSSILEKYNINSITDLVRYYEKNYNVSFNIFSNLNDVKMNYIARRYANTFLPNYDKFYYLNNLDGFYLSLDDYYYAKLLVFSVFENKNEYCYSVYFLNNNVDVLNDEIVKSIISSIKLK